jgi:hypothetical protein
MNLVPQARQELVGTGLCVSVHVSKSSGSGGSAPALGSLTTRTECSGLGDPDGPRGTMLAAGLTSKLQPVLQEKVSGRREERGSCVARGVAHGRGGPSGRTASESAGLLRAERPDVGSGHASISLASSHRVGVLGSIVTTGAGVGSHCERKGRRILSSIFRLSSENSPSFSSRKEESNPLLRYAVREWCTNTRAGRGE